MVMDKEMPKRFTIGPLGEHDDDWLTVWSWLNGRTKATQATMVLAYRVRDRKSQIQEMLDYVAKKRGISPNELMKQILDGSADRVNEGEASEIEE